MEAIKKELGQRIRQIRKRLGMNQSEFGELIGGVKKGAVSSYEQGDASPKPDSLVVIAERGGVTLDWLITGREPGAADPQLQAPAALPEKYQILAQVAELLDSPGNGREALIQAVTEIRRASRGPTDELAALKDKIQSLETLVQNMGKQARSGQPHRIANEERRRA